MFVLGVPKVLSEGVNKKPQGGGRTAPPLHGLEG